MGGRRFLLCGAVVASPGVPLRSPGYVAVVDNRIYDVGEGTPPDTVYTSEWRRLDLSGCLITPGLICTHHHLYQTITRGLAPDATLFEWLTTLYPLWAHLTPEMVEISSQAGLALLALSGCTTVADHAYLFPKDVDPFEWIQAEVAAAQRVGLRLYLARGAMDLGRSQGGLPPDEVVETIDEALMRMAQAVKQLHDPKPDAHVRVALGPCSPFSASSQLYRESARLARSLGVRLHTHLAETMDEEEYTRERFGVRPYAYVRSLGFDGPDLWVAHATHLDEEEIAAFAEVGTSVAHCPTSNGRLGAGIAPVAQMMRGGVNVGLGVDGAASNEGAQMQAELHQALLFARAKEGPTALSTQEVLTMATLGGARCLGWEAEMGKLEPGMLADMAAWRIDSLTDSGIHDPLAAWVLGTPRAAEAVWVDGRPVVQSGRLVDLDMEVLACELDTHSRRLLQAGGMMR